MQGRNSKISMLESKAFTSKNNVCIMKNIYEKNRKPKK